jgi:Ca2+-transporting ATPase
MNRETKWHYKEIDDVLKTLKLDASTKTKGISANEASKRLKEYGRNEIAEKKFKFPLWVRLLYRQTINLMSFVLLAAAIISAIVHDYVDATVIFVIIIINIIIGFLQEYRSETTMQKLKDMTARTCTVVRDGKNEEIPSAELVPGDLVVLAEGDQVPADMRIIACSSISCNESLLTGESVPSNKTADMIKQKPKHGRKPTLDEPIEVTNGNKKKKVIPLGDRTNMAFMNTCITRGEGKAIVVQTGMKTEIGKIASELESGGDEETPLQVSYICKN